MKAKIPTTKHESKPQKTVPTKFYNWWKEHRHSGFAEIAGTRRWSITPLEAWNCDRYMTEYSSCTGESYRPRYEYSAEEIESWAREQRDADYLVKVFADNHGGREIPNSKEFMQAIHLCSMFIAKKRAVEDSPGSKQDLDGYAKETKQEWLLHELRSRVTA